MFLKRLVPDKFVCQYPLSLGCMVFGVLMTLVKLACIMAIAIEMIGFAKCDSCTQSVLRCAYGFSGTAIIYCIIMISMHLWFLWAVKKRKSSVVLAWVVVTTMWLTQTFCLTVVLLCMYLAKTSLASWIVSVVFGAIAFGIAAYGVLLGLGLWFEMKLPQSDATTL